MKRLFNYILLLFTALLVGNQLFANYNKVEDTLSKTATSYKTSPSLILEFESFSEYKEPFLIQKDIKDKIELSESENETEDSLSIDFPNTFSFFDNYLYSHTFGNFGTLIQNGLAPCKHILYLATIKSRYIMFCVYRI